MSDGPESRLAHRFMLESLGELARQGPRRAGPGVAPRRPLDEPTHQARRRSWAVSRRSPGCASRSTSSRRAADSCCCSPATGDRQDAAAGRARDDRRRPRAAARGRSALVRRRAALLAVRPRPARLARGRAGRGGDLGTNADPAQAARDAARFLQAPGGLLDPARSASSRTRSCCPSP